MSLTAYPVESCELRYLEWAEPVAQEVGAKFYMMRVRPFHRVGIDISLTNDHSMATYKKFCTVQP